MIFIRSGIRGTTSMIPLNPFSAPKAILAPNKAPKYQFNNDEIPTGTSRKPTMGPPPGPPRSFKRRYIHNR